MVRCDVKISKAEFQRAFARFMRNSKRAKKTALTQQAKLFVGDVVRVTPPNRGSMNRAGGEKAIAGDLRHIFNPMPPALHRQAVEAGGHFLRREQRRKDGSVWLTDNDRVVSDLASFHQSQRRSNGRTTTAGRRTRDIGRHVSHQRGIVLVAQFQAYLRKAKRRVGILASGWNAAAGKLGLKLPDWITRHGTRYGSFSVKVTAHSMVIRVVNSVRFIGFVKGMRGRVQGALDNRARQMDKQMDEFAVKKAARDAGLKVR